jgi:cyclic pyranopterin phosphate synthase
MAGLTHLDSTGQAHMVDVGDKPITQRIAVAAGRVMMAADTLRLIEEGAHKKGDVLATARLAGIMGAKRTADLIPLCHPLPLDAVTVELTLDRAAPAVVICATVKVTGRTGVEMEALTAVSVAALTIYDMCKSVDRAMQVTDIRLIRKEGGRSGGFTAEETMSKT